MEMHFTAWVTTSPDCLTGDSADVVVLADEPAGVTYDEAGNEIRQWSSTGDPLLHAEIGIHYAADIAPIMARAEEILLDNRWQVIAPEWEAVSTGVVAEVAYNLNTGDRVTTDSGLGRLGDIGLEDAVVYGDDGQTYHIPVDEIFPSFDDGPEYARNDRVLVLEPLVGTQPKPGTVTHVTADSVHVNYDDDGTVIVPRDGVVPLHG